MGVDAPTICGRPLVPGEAPLQKGNPNLDAWLPVTAVDKRDVKCADSWVPRHPDLLRLTGAHPFNSEPPHKDVVEHGWLTPVSKHLVRNHGAVPRLDWATHRIKVGGLVGAPAELSMDDLLQLPHVTVPCLVTCCGNRRKETNMVKNSQGFSWGPGAVSVNWWTGVRLADVLKLVGAKTAADGARCVLGGFLVAARNRAHDRCAGSRAVSLARAGARAKSRSMGRLLCQRAQKLRQTPQRLLVSRALPGTGQRPSHGPICTPSLLPRLAGSCTSRAPRRSCPKATMARTARACH